MSKKTKKKNVKKRGFTLVELLATVVIIGILAGIGIVSVSRIISSSKEAKVNSQKDGAIMAMKSYLQSNKSLYPKAIGDSKNIKLSELKENNYLKYDVTNDKGESCMEKSFVRVYKLSRSEYVYTTFLYCGDDMIPDSNYIPGPVVTAKFSDSTGDISTDTLENVSDAYFYLDISAYEDKNKLGDFKNNDIYIDGYSFSIFAVIDNERKEVYNSGTLSANRKEDIRIKKNINDYIDVSTATELSVFVTAINSVGGFTNVNYSIGTKGNENSITYKDNTKPNCVDPVNPYKEDDWLNKLDFSSTHEVRTLTVGCDDGRGSGCIRKYFSKSWPNDDQVFGGEKVYVNIKDNAGNDMDCFYNVNVDIKSPEAVVTAYKANNTNDFSNDGKNVLNKTVSVDNNIETTVINPNTDYLDLVGNDSEIKWMNNNNYHNGVIYKIDIKDNLRLDHWTWNTNQANISDTNDSKYIEVSSSNPDSSSGVISQDESHGANIEHGSTYDTVYVRFLAEGKRYGVFTVYDKAGNAVSVKIAANIDRTPPVVPENLIAYKYLNSKYDEEYNFGTWFNSYVRVYTHGDYNKDNLSGFWTYYYNAKNYLGTRVGTIDYKVNENGKGFYEFKGSSSQIDGKNKISFKSCDVAGNCSDYGTEREVWIDTVSPVCNVKKTTSVNENSKGWLKKDETATVTASCDDSSMKNRNSGCVTEPFSYLYNFEINTSSAGAKGNDKGGSVVDAAGNVTNCSANQTVKIDYTAPTCKTSGGSTTWTNGSRNITGSCSDKGGSDCVKKSISTKYDYEIKTDTAAISEDNGRLYDNAGNYVDCKKDQSVYIDKTYPVCHVTKTTNVSENSAGWLKNGGTATVKASCTDEGGSSCKTADFSKTYKTNTNSSKAGANGIDAAGSVSDVAGNVTNCDFVTVKIDTESPTCSVSGGNSSWTNGSRKITATCSDTGGSGCSKNSFSKTYSSFTNTTTAGAVDVNNGGSFTDVAGNSVDCSYNQTVKVDPDDPSVSCKLSSHTISITSSSDSGSGIKDTYYSFDGGKTYGTSNKGGSACGTTYKAYAKVVDKAGNSAVASCGSYTTGDCAPPIPKNNCKIRGSRKRTQSYTWQCTCGKTHNQGYMHYCSDGSGNLLTKDSNPSIVTFRWVCPISPYGTSDGWTIVSD